jgi:hypothetical protein
MSDSDSTGFGKFVPGFDFLQSLAKGASASVPQMPNLGNWVAPTLNVEELDKRIGELKNVQFWLEQNSRALSATIQALEVQKMTLATLKGMNFNLGDVANAFKLKPAEPATSSVTKATEAAKPTAEVSGNASGGDSSQAGKAADAAQATAGAGLVDPLQLWGALTTQFQQIAATAMQEVTSSTAASMAKGAAAAKAASKKAPVKKAATKKTAAKKAPASSTRK